MSDTPEPVRITVETQDEGRVDKALARHFPDAGRKQLSELFDAGDVRVKGKKAKKGDRVAAGDTIDLARAPITGARTPVADPTVTLEVLLERPDLIALAKPVGIATQPLRAGELGTMANGVAARWPECAAIGDDARDGGLVHRLDIGTSGILVAARNAATYRGCHQGRSLQKWLLFWL